MTGGGVRIRRGEPGDADALARVQIETWRAAYRGLVPRRRLDALEAARLAAVWDEILRGGGPVPGSATLVAEGDGGIRGYACFGPAMGWPPPAPSATAELYALYARPGEWGRGVGSALVRAMDAVLREQGHRSVLLWVLRGNARARRFYARTGWVEDGGERPREAPDLPVPAVRYRRDL